MLDRLRYWRDNGRMGAPTSAQWRGFSVAAWVSGLAMAVGCNAISGLGDYSVVVAGAGGATSTGSDGGGGGGDAACTTAADCPDALKLCEAATCEGGVCGAQPIGAGDPSWQQTKGDCHVIVCDADGMSASQGDETDLPDDGQDCTEDVCLSGVPSNPPTAMGAPCQQNGGKKCNGLGACVDCLDDADCPGGACQDDKCVPASCIDGAKNAAETDIDCGGPDCGACAPGATCIGPSDCDSAVCQNGTCAAPSCGDGTQNGTESGVDCGGPTCNDCATGQGCALDGDCATTLCQGGVCQAGITIQVEGHAPVGVPCSVGDYNCQAQWVCNKVTSSSCQFQDYDCCFGGGNGGSWYPPDGLSGGSNFNFAVGYDFCVNAGDYGNICACDQNQMNVYGLAQTHTYCGVGHWQRQ